MMLPRRMPGESGDAFLGRLSVALERAIGGGGGLALLGSDWQAGPVPVPTGGGSVASVKVQAGAMVILRASAAITGSGLTEGRILRGADEVIGWAPLVTGSGTGSLERTETPPAGQHAYRLEMRGPAGTTARAVSLVVLS